MRSCWERRAQPLGLGLGARRLQRVRLGDERHDDEGLATLRRLGGQEGLDLRHGPAIADLRADRLPSGRQVADRADRQVAVHAEGQCSRDRGGGQRQHVRLSAAPLRLQCRSLPDAEPMLLVDDHQAQPRELDRLADHRVRADHDLSGTGGDRIVDRSLARRGQGPGQELCPHPEALEQRCQAGVVLPRQDLGRSHQRPLPPGANRACQGDGGDRGLAAADVALQQAAHRPLAGDLVDDLGDGRFLVVGQREWQRTDDLCPGGIGYRDARRPQAGACLPCLCERQLEGEQLVERQAVERLGHVGRLLGEVRGAQRVVERHEPPALFSR